MPYINLLALNAGRKTIESGKGAVDDDLSMTRSYHPDSGDEDNAMYDAPNVSITELESTLQQLLSEVNEDPLLVEHEQKLREVTDRLGENYKSNSRENVDKVVELLRQIGFKAPRLSKLANDVAAHLLFKQINPRYPVYPIYPTYSYSGLGTSQDPYSNAPFIQGLVQIDLHGLHINEAKRFVEYHLDLCHLCDNLYETVIICGWGKHNQGKGVLKKALMEFLKERDETSEGVIGNLGRLRVFVRERPRFELLRDEFEINRDIAEGSSACVTESENESESVEVTAPRSFVHRQASQKYGPDTGSWED